MAAVDYIIIITLVIGVISGVSRGFLRQVFSLGGLVIGIILGSFLFRPFADFLTGKVSMDNKVAQIVAFALILIVVPIVCGLLGRMLSKVVRFAGLGLVDRLMGAVSGALIWLLLAGVIVHLMELTGLSDGIAERKSKNDPRTGSLFYGPVRDVSAQCLQWTWSKVQSIDLPDFAGDSSEE